MKHFWRAGIIALGCSLLIISCKKDKQSDQDPTPTQNNFLPNAGNYTYHVAATDGTTGDETITVSNKRDTAGGHAVTMTSVTAGYHLSATRYADAANTIDPIYPPQEFDSLANLIRSQPGISQFTYTGWPVYQQMPNTAALNNVLSFSGGPIHLHFVTIAGVTDYAIEYVNGKVVQTNQKITTPAGSYTCSAWAYGVKTTATLPNGTFVSNFSDTVWMAPGVPFVKSSELSQTAYSVTMLTKVN
jgi:hypothetical protein